MLQDRKVTVLDGGMGGEIRQRLEGADHGLWSARALADAPDIVLEIHREYIDAGADVITTNSYSTIPSYIGKEHQDADTLQQRCVELTRLAGELARQAAAGSTATTRSDTKGKILVAGSVPPLSESYRPDLVPPESEALPVYEDHVRALAPSVDLYICETMSSSEEAMNAATQALRHGGGKPVYVSFTLNEAAGHGLRSGETVREAYDRLNNLDIAGFMFNCTSPEAIEAALIEIRQLTDKPLGGYANRFSVPPGWTLDNNVVTDRRGDITQDYFVQRCLGHIDAGASMVGGCCGIGPSDIRALSDSIIN
jgi:S-methylmethionine-dependent homocysteine/selenocysteine methylase